MAQKVRRYEVIAISDEFLKVLDSMPEASTASRVKFGDKWIDGPKVILIVSSKKEVIDNLPDIVAKLADPEHHHLRIIKKTGECYFCVREGLSKNPEIPIADCPHIDKMGVAILNESWTIDVKEYLQDSDIVSSTIS